ncbi:MAG: ABC transporter six-transmembrane domain-containing protein [Pseudomonadales bacterium]|nr:ABC transporter six-transmembrane domain-containing protein [Pseudomonadales bacterium]
MIMTTFDRLDLWTILRLFKGRVLVTWFLVFLENVLMALIPLLMGFAIDGLLAGNLEELSWLAGLLVALLAVAVGRRAYDTRAYGHIRVELGVALEQRQGSVSLSSRNAHLTMARELVDFLEETVPEFFTAIIQIVCALVLLALMDMRLALSALSVTLGMVVFYSLFHQRFYNLNRDINALTEKQVTVLEKGGRRGLFHFLSKLKHAEIKLSDTEAVLYGLIYLLQFCFVIYNLWLSAQLLDITPGKIFTILSYSWEYVEAAVMLPIVMQTLSRLQEISNRLNQRDLGSDESAVNDSSSLLTTKATVE